MHARNESESLLTQAVWAALLGYHVAEHGVEVSEIADRDDNVIGVNITARRDDDAPVFEIRLNHPVDVTTQIATAARKIAAM